MEEVAKIITVYVGYAVEILAAVIVGLAVIKTIMSYVQSIRGTSFILSKEEIRVQFGSSVAVSLELLLGADVLATAVAPSWDDIGKLAAIAVLRTALNYFLERELKHINTMQSNKRADRHVPAINANANEKSFIRKE